MATREQDFSSSWRERRSNVLGTERLASIAGGLGLAAAALRGGGPLSRALLGVAGAALLSRGATRYCPMKAAATGQTTLGRGFSEQARRAISAIRGGTASIGSMEEMYRAELQELDSAESLFVELLESVGPQITHPTLRERLQGYATEMHSRRDDISRILESRGADPHAHPDQAMEALVGETHKMAKVAGASVRDAGLVASLQRIIHYRIAGYGTVAAYAKALDRLDEAARFAEYVERDRALDEELTELAKGTINPQAVRAPSQTARVTTAAAMEGRPH